jgi:hypothetical protein
MAGRGRDWANQCLRARLEAKLLVWARDNKPVSLVHRRTAINHRLAVNLRLRPPPGSGCLPSEKNWRSFEHLHENCRAFSGASMSRSFAHTGRKF